jgi:hypothetical protein
MSWTCAASAGASCGAALGSGSINSTVNLPVGGAVIFTVTGTVSATTIAPTLVNTATVTTPTSLSDPNPGNNSATDTDTIVVPLPALTSRDNFNRPNSGNLGSNWQQVNLFGLAGIRVNNNEAQYQAFSYATWNSTANGANPVFGSKQAAAIQLAGTNFVGDTLVLKASGTYNGAFYPNRVQVRVVSTTQVAVELWANTTVYTLVGNLTTPTLVTGDTLSAMVDANGAAYVWKTTGTTTTYLGALQLPTTGSNAFTLSTGRIGIYMQNSNSNGRADNFAGGTVP